MLTQAPRAFAPYTPSAAGERSDDMSGHRHRQVIGYLGLVLPVLLVWTQRWRANPPSDGWEGGSISAYYWTGAVSLFAGLLAVLSVFLLTYRGYANESRKRERGAAIVAGVAAAVVALFPTSPPSGLATLPWYHDWISMTHTAAAIILFSMFAVFSLVLFRKTAAGEARASDKKQRDAIYLVCGIGILASMAWSVVAGWKGMSIFWPESLALMFFAWSWLTKGRALHSIKATVRAATASAGKRGK